jgi:hypothetical protein
MQEILRPRRGGESSALYQHIDFAQCAVLNYCVTGRADAHAFSGERKNRCAAKGLDSLAKSEPASHIFAVQALTGCTTKTGPAIRRAICISLKRRICHATF